VSVEAELGRIGKAGNENIETEDDTELYTDPREARRFVDETGVDALAVSVGTVHGVYTVRRAKIDFDRLRAIRAETAAPLVLHGGSGVPPEDIQHAIHIPGGGVTKINIATDLVKRAARRAGAARRMLNAECLSLPPEQLAPALDAVEQTVIDKITHILSRSEGLCGAVRSMTIAARTKARPARRADSSGEWRRPGAAWLGRGRIARSGRATALNQRARPVAVRRTRRGRAIHRRSLYYAAPLPDSARQGPHNVGWRTSKTRPGRLCGPPGRRRERRPDRDRHGAARVA